MGSHYCSTVGNASNHLSKGLLSGSKDFTWGSKKKILSFKGWRGISRIISLSRQKVHMVSLEQSGARAWRSLGPRMGNREGLEKLRRWVKNKSSGCCTSWSQDSCRSSQGKHSFNPVGDIQRYRRTGSLEQESARGTGGRAFQT